MNLSRNLLQLSLAGLFCMSTHVLAAEPWFIINTDTPQVTLNQSMSNEPIYPTFNITNNIQEETGVITISDLPQGVKPNFNAKAESCEILNYNAGNNTFTLASLANKATCTVNLVIESAASIGNTNIVLDPKVCARENTRCSKALSDADKVHIFIIDDFQKVVVIVFENEDADVALSYPMFKKIAEEGVYFDNFHAVSRPSQPNYIAMIGANTFGVNSNAPVSLNEDTIVNLLEDSDRSWKAYAENYPKHHHHHNQPGWNPAGCFLNDNGLYVRKHNPFISFKTITNSPQHCKKIVNAQHHFKRDALNKRLPDYSFYIPNLIHNGHDQGLEAADKWLKDYMYPIMEHPVVLQQNVLFILLFDESNPHGTPDEVAENKIYTTFWGPMVRPSKIVSEDYDFYNMIRTIEDIWNLGSLDQNDATSTIVTPTIWKN